MDIQKIRKDTPHCEDKLFFNSAGASLVPSIVTNRMIDYLKEEADIGGYALGLGDRIQGEISEFYTEVSKMINCTPRNIAFSINASDGFAQSIFSIPFEKGDVVITTDDDYISNHAQFSQLHKRFGVHTVRVKNLSDGAIDIDHLMELILEHNPRLISVTHIPTNTGKIQDVETVGKICKEKDILFIIDACQSAGQMPIDVQKLNCDFLCASGRKFLRGPRATGFLFVSDKVLERNYMPLRLDGRGVEWIGAAKFRPYNSALRYETWEQNYACVLGLKEAVRYGNNLGWDNIYTYNQSLLQHTIKAFEKIDGIRILDQGPNRANIFTFIHDKMEKQTLIKTLEENDVYFTTAFRGAALIDFDKKGVDWAIRLSPHYFNTKEEVDRIVEIIG